MMIYGVLLTLTAVAVAVGGYRLRQKLFSGWDEPRIGAIDMLFTLKGLAAIVMYAAFHFLWFVITFTALIVGVVYITQ